MFDITRGHETNASSPTGCTTSHQRTNVELLQGGKGGYFLVWCHLENGELMLEVSNSLMAFKWGFLRAKFGTRVFCESRCYCLETHEVMLTVVTYFWCCSLVPWRSAPSWKIGNLKNTFVLYVRDFMKCIWCLGDRDSAAWLPVHAQTICTCVSWGLIFFHVTLVDMQAFLCLGPGSMCCLAGPPMPGGNITPGVDSFIWTNQLDASFTALREMQAKTTPTYHYTKRKTDKIKWQHRMLARL